MGPTSRGTQLDSAKSVCLALPKPFHSGLVERRLDLIAVGVRIARVLDERPFTQVHRTRGSRTESESITFWQQTPNRSTTLQQVSLWTSSASLTSSRCNSCSHGSLSQHRLPETQGNPHSTYLRVVGKNGIRAAFFLSVSPSFFSPSGGTGAASAGFAPSTAFAIS